jgi:hypothetical protein
VAEAKSAGHEYSSADVDSALAALERMRAGLEATLAHLAEYAHLLVRAARVDLADWQAMAPGRPKEQVLSDGRRNLVRAVGVTMAQYEALPGHGRARSNVLLAGAALMGIATTWPGWELDDPAHDFCLCGTKRGAGPCWCPITELAN